MPGCDGAGRAERSYPTFKVRRGAAERRYPATNVRGGSWKELPTPQHPRPGAAVGRSNPTCKEPWLHGRRRA